MSLKHKLLELSQKDPKRFFPVEAIQELGYVKKKCKICGRTFWTLDPDREVCGDHEPYGFIGKGVGEKLSYPEVWKSFSKFFERRGYLPIKRYPVVARWRDDLEFVIASIADFQPWVVEGIVDPPSKKLTVPQFSLRFNDIGNVGFTGRHYTGFVMIGQHAFVPPEEYDINSYFRDLYDWFISIGIPREELVLHEDGWAGGGNGGTSIEFFYMGLEAANQVYMQFKVNEETGEISELSKLKVLDMGLGQERIAWLLNGTATSYDVTFPKTIKYLRSILREDFDYNKLERITPYYSQFDFEEKSIRELIQETSKILGENTSNLIEISGAVYSIADHARSLLIAISDGMLPSNIGGGYNLRLLVRRMYNFLEKYFVDYDLGKIFESVLSDWYEPELKEYVPTVVDIVDHEIRKYKETKRKASKILKSIVVKKENLTPEKVFELYTSYGITPELIKEFIPDFEVPRDFYKRLEEFRKKSKVKKSKKDIEIDVSEFPKTYKKFYESWKLYRCEATLLGIKDGYLIADQTVFYPLKGGQMYDTGYVVNLSRAGLSSEEAERRILDGNLDENFVRVVEVYDKSGVILHKLERVPNWKPGDKLFLMIDKERRYSLARHHTATHILTGALRRYYGKHVWQAGAEKTPNGARLDVTHYKLPSKEEIREIEKIVNRIILEGRVIRKREMRRDEAERKYGFVIYQGGFIPDVNLRIVEIEDWDVEACSGTHLDNTLEVGFVKITNVKRIADGMIRFEFVAGEKALEYIHNREKVIEEIEQIANTSIEYVPSVIEKVCKERDEYRKKYNALLEKLVDSVISDGKLIGKLPLKVQDVLPVVMKKQKEIKYIDLEMEDGKITSEEVGGARRVGKFYLLLHR